MSYGDLRECVKPVWFVNAAGEVLGDDSQPVIVQGTMLVDDGWTVEAIAGSGTANRSWEVPEGRLWQPLFLAVKLVTDATAGNRELQVQVERSGMAFAAILARAGTVQAASTTRYYLFGAGTPDLTTMRGTASANWLSTPLPVTTILQGGDRLRLLDVANVSANDAMDVWLQYAWKEV